MDGMPADRVCRLCVLVFCVVGYVSADGTAWAAFGGGSDHSSFVPVSVLSLSNISGVLPAGVVVGGRSVWSASVSPPTGNDFVEVLSYPTYVNDRIFVTTQRTGMTPSIVVLNATTGQLIKQTPVTQIPNSRVLWVSTPVLNTNLNVYYVQSTISLPGTGAYAVVSCYDLWNNSLMWNFSSPSATSVSFGPTVSASLLYLAASSLFVLDAASGSLAMVADVGRHSDWTPTIYHQRVFLNAHPYNNSNYPVLLGEMSSSNSTMLWVVYDQDSTIPAELHTVPVIRDDIGYVTTEPTIASIVALYAVNINTHQLYRLGQADKCYPTDLVQVGPSLDFSPAVDDQYIYLTCRDGVHRYSANPLDTNVLVYPCADACSGQPIITSDLVIVSGAFTTQVYDKRTAQRITQLPTPGHLALNPQTGHIITANPFTGIITVYQMQLQQAPTTTPTPTSPTAAPAAKVFSLTLPQIIGVVIGGLLLLALLGLILWRCQKRTAGVTNVNSHSMLMQYERS